MSDKSIEKEKLSPIDEKMLSCLIEEWKQNVSLYIDQDKRGFNRIKMFLLIHAGLLVFFTEVFRKIPKDQPFLILFICSFIAVIGLAVPNSTRKMSNLAHAFILLRKTQGMLIEEKIRNLFYNLNSKLTWKDNPGIVTTFTREHVAFFTDLDSNLKKKKSFFKSILFWKKPKDNCEIKKEMNQWIALRQELIGLGPDYTSKPFTANWKPSIGHLAWLQNMFNLLFLLWFGLLIMVFVYYAFPYFFC